MSEGKVVVPMSPDRPRIGIPLSDEQHEDFRKHANKHGVSVTALACEVVNEWITAQGA